MASPRITKALSTAWLYSSRSSSFKKAAARSAGSKALVRVSATSSAVWPRVMASHSSMLAETAVLAAQPARAESSGPTWLSITSVNSPSGPVFAALLAATTWEIDVSAALIAGMTHLGEFLLSVFRSTTGLIASSAMRRKLRAVASA